jgi:beta-N-acetylhexosaminidase
MQDGKVGPGSAMQRPPTPPRPAGYVLGAELRACGVDFSFTPVLDLDWGSSG